MSNLGPDSHAYKSGAGSNRRLPVFFPTHEAAQMSLATHDLRVCAMQIFLHYSLDLRYLVAHRSMIREW